VTVTRIPVPPRGERPFIEGLASAMVDPWIGPTNEIWRALVAAAKRELRLIELEAPPVILENERARVQDLLEAAWRATREAPALPRAVSPVVEGALVPPLESPLTDLDEWAAVEMCAVAALAGGGFVIQEPSRVRVVDADGRVRCELPPAGCKLAGTHGDLAVFHGFFSATHPAFAAGIWSDAEGIGEHNELTVLDTRAGCYLERAPEGLPARFLEHGEPEELMLGGERLDIGGDRPDVFAYATGLLHAWIGEDDDTRILELATAIPHVVPTRPAGAAPILDPATRQRSEPTDDEDEDELGGSAIVFAGDRWLLLWPDGRIADHRGTPIVRLAPPPRAAAFSPDGRTLACLLAEGRLAVLEL
jgi:hypothetical protein